jgi:hypothetical protein
VESRRGRNFGLVPILPAHPRLPSCLLWISCGSDSNSGRVPPAALNHGRPPRSMISCIAGLQTNHRS